MLEFLSVSKTDILEFLREYFRSIDRDYRGINRWGADTSQRLLDYLSGGKMIRGGLIRFTHDMYGGSHSAESTAAGAAMELFQAAFLIHDDIMDRDAYRRGKPSMHAQYSRLAAEEGNADSAHMGEALGICIGDLAIFQGNEILGTLDIPAEMKTRLLRRFSRELEFVGIAQMGDVYQGASPEPVSKEDILTLYRYKTGRYTFSLPFAAGLILAGCSEDIVNRFILLGEKMGILFQIKDDELGLWADEEELGKPVGSDIGNDKKTLFRELLFAKALPKERKKLAEIFGNGSPSPQDILFVRQSLKSSGVAGEVAAYSSALDKDARALVANLDIAAEWKAKLSLLLDFNRDRSK